MKRILHVSYSMDTGGGPMLIKRITEDFPEYDHFVAGNPGVFLREFEARLHPSKILYLKGANLFLNVILLFNFCRKNKIAILHVHGRGAGAFSRFIKILIRNLKIIYTPNGFFPRSLPAVIRHFYVFFEWLLLPLTDKVWLVSQTEVKTFSEYFGKAAVKIRCILNYITPENKIYSVKIAVDGLSKSQLNLLFIGRFTAQKGIDILVESVKALEPSHHFCVCMVGYGKLEEYLRREAEDPRLKGRLILLGKMDDAFRIMQNFDALLLPSRFEGLPFTVLEAMLHQLPLIVTPANGITDILNKENSYMAEEISSESYAAAIRNFLYDHGHRPDRIHEMIGKNYGLLFERYSLKAVETQIKEVYNN